MKEKAKKPEDLTKGELIKELANYGGIVKVVLKANETAERLLKFKSSQKEKILIGSEVTND